ncbi:MAG: hypothetical protein QOF12_2826 [Solirubrobacteraceae bacterium]|nr:hypothetical protein [Solirubrobacteraceae bacterium]
MTARLRITTVLAGLAIAAPLPVAHAAAMCPASWKLTGTDSFRAADALVRSQGVTSDGHGWIFSWQGGMERTLDDYTPTAIGAISPQFVPSVSASGENHIADTHIGDIDTYHGLIYAPEEDGGESLGPLQLNDPEYQRPHIALYDARTLAYTGVSYPLDVGISEAGVPWVAIDARRQQVYTAEWDMPHDRLNVFDLQMGFKRFLALRYPASLGAGFHLSRIQGAKVWGHLLYATRDDAAKTVFSIDLRTGEVTRLFSLNPSTPHAELEGLAVRRTADGALLHVLIVLNNDLPNEATQIHVDFDHYAPVGSGPCS